MNLRELQQRRLNWVAASRENRFEGGIKRLLADLYPDNAHFIYELLQNAEDAQATEVRFILKEDEVEFEHNGDRLFTLEDVDSITSIGNSTKKDDPTNIGKFGIGFKAVFAYSSTPRIQSGEFHFRIRDLVIPDTDGLPRCQLCGKETRFFFPFDNPEKRPEKARAEIERHLRQLDESSLLFLSNIKKIEYLLPDSTLGFLERREADGNRIEIRVQHPEDSKPASVFFLRFEKTVNVNDEDDKPKSCRVAVAFGLEKPEGQEWKITPLNPGQVCIYFPAEKETSNLRFHLHAPFASTVARDSVRDCEANNELRDHLVDLVSESMTAIRNQALLTVGFLATLPNDKDNVRPLYKPIMEQLIETFKNKKLTPMKQGGHAAAMGIFRGPARLSNLINDNDLATFLGDDYSPPMWTANPTQRNQREDNFLAMLNIPEWTTEHLVNELSVKSETTTQWLAEKSNEWHQTLYSLLADYLSNAPSYPSSVARMRKYKLSRLRVVPCSDDQYRVGRQCYFPSDYLKQDEDFPRVVKGVYSSGTSESQQEKARKFLEGIGVRKVGEAEEIEAILKKRYSCEQKYPISPDDDSSERKAKTDLMEVRAKLGHRDIRRFIEFVQKESEKAGLFSKYFIFQLENGKWGKPGMVFLDAPYLDTGLRAYFGRLGEGSGRKWALSPKYQESGIDPEKLRKFADAVGAQTRLEVVRVSCWDNPDSEYLLGAPGRYRYKNSQDTDYVVPRLEKLLKTHDEKLSKLVWRTMSELPDCYLKATHQKNRSHFPRVRDSQLVHQLRNAKWIPQKHDESLLFVKPCDAIVERFPKGFPSKVALRWLKAIEFGKTERDRKDLEHRKQEQSTQDYRHKDTAAKELDFSSVEEAREAKKMMELKHKDPEGFKRWQESNREKPPFPTNPATNPKRRQERLAQEHANAPGKGYEKRERGVRTTREEIDPDTWLREWYTNESEQMICQICKKAMPFRKRNGEYYFEAVEILSKDYFPKEHEAQFLALCPLCAARFKEFIKREETAMKELHDALKNGAGLEFPLELGELKTSLRFVETHRQDIKTILHQ